MSGGAGSPSFYSFTNDLGEDNQANRSLRYSFKILSHTRSNAQILELAQSFRECSDEEIIRGVEESRRYPSSVASSNRASIFSVRSYSSQATTVSNQSLPPPLPTKRPQYENWPASQLYLQLQPTSHQELAEPVNQGSAIVYICVACNRLCRNKSSLLRHQTQHCERVVEWSCSLCVLRKRFYRKDKLSEHHIKIHGRACVAGCKEQQGGLCKWHLDHSAEESWPKKAWGCPCCPQCFDTLAAWTIHSGSHPVQNDSVVGWSLSTMVQSLLLQPYLEEATARLPWHTCDLAKVKAEVFQELREVLERHKLPIAVHDHYDYRHLLLPEKLAYYTFRRLTNQEVFPDDVSNLASGDGTRETELSCNGRRGQMFAPGFDVSGSATLGYWNPENPSVYDENAHQSVEPSHVHESHDEQLLSNACGAQFKTEGIGATVEQVFGGYPQYPYHQVLQTSSDISSGDQASSLAPVGVSGNVLQGPGCCGRVHHDLGVQKPLQTLVHLPSSTNSITLNTKPLPEVPVLADDTSCSRSGDRHQRRHSRCLSRSRERRRDDHQDFETRDHHRHQIPLPAPADPMTLELSRTTTAVDHSTDSSRTESEAGPISSQPPRLTRPMSDIRSDDWHLWEP